MSHVVGESPWNIARKVTTETRSADSATLADDAVLKFAMLANTKYAIRASIFWDTVAAADIKFRHVGPASPTLVRILRWDVAPGTVAVQNLAVDVAYSSGDIACTSVGTTGGWLTLEGIIHNGANAGDFKIQWAQNVSDAGNTSVLAGSFLEWVVT